MIQKILKPFHHPVCKSNLEGQGDANACMISIACALISSGTRNKTPLVKFF